MKRHLLALGCTLSLMLAGSGYAQAVPAQPDVAALSAGKCQTVASENEVIAVGPPVLTLQAADCALDFIAFTASEVRGGKHMEVDPAMRVDWRGYLATQYVTLAPADRIWFANAPDTMAAVRNNFRKLSWLQRISVRQQWAAAMPAMLQFVAPVVMASQEGAPRQSMARQLADMIRIQQLNAMLPQQQQNAAAAQDLAAQKELFNNSMRTTTLQKGMIVSTQDTINLMHVYSGH